MRGREGVGAKNCSPQIQSGPKTFGAEGNLSDQTGISIFDPVLTELMYKWFCPKDGSILDPFAGGSVRGVVASKLGCNYLGVDLSERQVEANKEQAATLCPERPPLWIADDSINVLTHAGQSQFDMLFTCPPYTYLEVYSDDPRDISNMSYADFLAKYRDIIANSCKALKDDSFAAIVIGEVRDKKTGNYVNFVGDTIKAFLDAGLNYYNEMILVTAVGSLPLRAGRVFNKSRKIGKTHQNILVFVKGDGKKATQRCGEIKLEGLFDDEGAVATDQ